MQTRGFRIIIAVLLCIVVGLSFSTIYLFVENRQMAEAAMKGQKAAQVEIGRLEREQGEMLEAISHQTAQMQKAFQEMKDEIEKLKKGKP